jgi:streptogramin lyase
MRRFGNAVNRVGRLAERTHMSDKMTLLKIVGSMAVVAISLAVNPASAAQRAAPAALSGRVSSQEEGPMEGVLVSAKKEGSTITTTVVTDPQGRYGFSRTRLEPGRYALRIRATGYDLNGPGPVDITAQKTTQLDLKLHKTKDLASQLTNAEWFMSWPGTRDQKMAFVDSTHADCITCHTVERISRSHYNAADFAKVVERMRGWASGSTPAHPMKKLHVLPVRAGTGLGAETGILTGLGPENFEYVTSVNLSKVSNWEYPLQTLPRPKGRATRVVITEYDLPRAHSSPHDVVMAPNGMVWYCDFGQQYIGMLDPKTGKVVEYPVPTIKPGFDSGMNNLEIDRQGTLWLALFYQAGLAKFDPKTQQFQTWKLPKELDSDTRKTTFLAAMFHDVDGKIWLGGGHDKDFRLDVQSGHWDAIDEPRDIPKDAPIMARPYGTYGLASDSKNNLYVFDIGSEYIIKVDAKNLRAGTYQIPTFAANPRRGRIDNQDRLWFAEHGANKIGMFDTNSGQFREWAIQTPFSNPYDVVLDRNEEAWTGGMTSDRIVRLNSKTGEMTEYLLPQSTNVRRVDVDNSTTPVTFWVGNNDAASIVRLEPLE